MEQDRVLNISAFVTQLCHSETEALDSGGRGGWGDWGSGHWEDRSRGSWEWRHW